MKKTRFASLMAMLLCCIMIALSGCNKSSRHDRDDDDEDEKVSQYSETAAQKMLDKNERGKLTKDDYSTCIDWLEQGYTELYNKLNSCIESSSSEAEFYDNCMKLTDQIQAKYPNMQGINDILDKADEEEMGPANYRRYNSVYEKFDKKLEKLQQKAETKFPSSEYQ